MIETVFLVHIDKCAKQNRFRCIDAIVKPKLGQTREDIKASGKKSIDQRHLSVNGKGIASVVHAISQQMSRLRLLSKVAEVTTKGIFK